MRGTKFSIIGRDRIAARCAVALLLGVVLGCGACKPEQPTLTLLVWEGYADPSFLGAFEESHHCKVVASYMGTSDELVAKLRGGSASNYDVISPSSDVAASIVRAGLAAPLDLSKIPAYSQLSPSFANRTSSKFNGQVYGVPFVWGPNPLLYDTTAFAQRTGFVGNFLGCEISWQSLGVGRTVHRLYGGAGAWVR